MNADFEIDLLVLQQYIVHLYAKKKDESVASNKRVGRIKKTYQGVRLF